MWFALKAFFQPLIGKIVTGALLAGGLLLVVLRIKRSGKEEARREQLEGELKARRNRDEIEDEVRRIDPTAARDELFRDWSRD